MISRAACAPRICLACRQSLAHRGAGLGFRTLPRQAEPRWQRFGTSTNKNRQLPNAKPDHSTRFIGKWSTDTTNVGKRRQGSRKNDDKLQIRTKEDVERSILGNFGKTKRATTPNVSSRTKEAGIQKPAHGQTSQTATRADKQRNKRQSRNARQKLAKQKQKDERNEVKSMRANKEDVERAILGDLYRKRPKVIQEESTTKVPEVDISSVTAGEEKADPEMDLRSSEQDASLPEFLEDATTAEELFETDSLEEVRIPRQRRSRKGEFRNELVVGRKLGVSALGVPANAIVIKNPNQMRLPRRPVTQVDEEPQKSDSAIKWENLVSREQREEVSELSDEAMLNIEELRPTDTKTLRLKDFNNLIQSLCDGFTTAQLRDYYRDYEMAGQAQGEKSTELHWALKQIPWTPIQTLQLADQSPKQIFAQKIVLSKWDVQIQEQVDGLGRAFIWVKPDLYPLLVQGSQSVVEKLREGFLDVNSQERLSTTSDAYRLNITARKSSTYAILERLGQLFDSMERRQVSLKDLKKFMRSAPTAKELTELARITNTYIGATKDKDIINVSWLQEDRLLGLDTRAGDQPPMPSKTEDLADVVSRLLIQQSTKKGPSSHKFEVCLPDGSATAAGNGMFAGFYRESRSMAWRDKLRRWSRYVHPVSRSETTETSEWKSFSESNIHKVPKANKPDVTTHTTATFGHILHSEPQTNLANLSKNRRIIAPLLPHPAALSELKVEDGGDLKQATSIILHFTPLGSSDPETTSGKEFPVKMTVPVDSDADLSDFTKRNNGVLDGLGYEFITDIGLPSESVDLRLATRRSSPVMVKNQAGLKDFFAASELNLLEGRLRTPSRVTLTIHPAAYGGDALAPKIDVEFMFSGLEVRQTVDMPWKGHMLRYSTIEAGQHGGQRQELTFETFAKPGSDEFQSFMNLTQELATGKHFSWDEGFKAMKEQRFEDHSFELPEDAASKEFTVHDRRKSKRSPKKHNQQPEDTKEDKAERTPRFFQPRVAPLPTSESPFAESLFEENDEEIFAGMEDFTPQQRAQFRRDFESAISLDAEYEADMKAKEDKTDHAARIPSDGVSVKSGDEGTPTAAP